ncbi:MAG: TolC family protein [Bacteroidales bacterium]|nr:TolC family protein [Bacteroidales bacterium]MDT8430580.1 TolC family protein [Bacteroidales bacterium]
MSRIFLIAIMCSLPGLTIYCQNPVLEKYLIEGIASNHALRQRQLDYNQSLAALRESRGMFFPEISLNARYTVADGGRVISFPVGDLLNPVYNTLNMLTSSEFPEIENEEFKFYRPREHETKVTLVQPIYNSDIIYNARIRQEYATLAHVEMEQYKRHLIREIKTAYYNYQKAWHLGALVDSTLVLVEENHRVSKTLHDNNMVTIDAVFRSESEVSSVQLEQAHARSHIHSAKAYFNFLINRPLDSDIKLYHEIPAGIFIPLDAAQEEAISNREELESVKRYQVLNAQKRRMQQGHASPDLFGTVDYGFQGEEYRFTETDDFVLASLVLRWRIFQGMSNRNKVRQTVIEGEKLVQVLDEIEQKIRMQVIGDYYQALAAFQAIDAASKQVRAAQKAFSLIDRKYRENQSTLLEYIDARTSYTSAEANLIIATNEYFIRLAAMEFSMAGIDLEKY